MDDVELWQSHLSSGQNESHFTHPGSHLGFSEAVEKFPLR